MDKVQILNKLYEYKKFKTKSDFAMFLGISPQNLSAWYSRVNYDINILLTKFPELNPNWLTKGEGDMFQTQPQGCCKYGKILPLNLNNVNVSIEEYAQKNELFDYSVCQYIPQFSYAYQIQSRALEPYLYKGDWILMEKIELSDVKIGNTYLIDTKSYGKTIRRLDYNENSVILSLPPKIPNCNILQINKNDIDTEIYAVYDIITQIKVSAINFVDVLPDSSKEIIKQNSEFLDLAKTAIKNQETTLALLKDAMEIIKLHINGKSIQ